MNLLRLLANAALSTGQSGQQSAPAASMGAETFFNAAQKAGLPTDHETLNQIVTLVNQGYSPDQAATQVKGKKNSLPGGLLSPQPMQGLTHKPSKGLLDNYQDAYPQKPL